MYPVCCISTYCDRIRCEGCRNLPILQEFKQWVKDTKAIVKDPIWGRLTYVSTIPEETICTPKTSVTIYRAKRTKINKIIF